MSGDGSTGLFDIFGPVMLGPSSSHTAGVCRIAFIARSIFVGEVEKAVIRFFGSLAATYAGHGSDRAAVGGLLGIRPDDERMSFSLELADKLAFPYSIVAEREKVERYHPNTVVIELEGGKKRLRVRGASIGGGNILIQSVNGYSLDLRGELDAVLALHHDEVGVIAIVSHILAASRVNIANAVSHRKDKGDEAMLVIEVDGTVPTAALDQIHNLPAIYEVVYVPAIKG
jgi:L-serine dehydratase